MNIDSAKKIKWYKQQTEGTPYFIYWPCLGCVAWFKHKEKIAWICQPKEARAFLDQHLMKDLAAKDIKAEKKKRGHFKKIYDNWHKDVVQANKEIFAKIDDVKLRAISDKELLALNKELGEQSKKMWVQYFMDIYDYDPDFHIDTELLAENIRLKSKEKEVMVMQDKYIVHQLEDRDALRIAKLIKNNAKAKADFKKIKKSADLKLLKKYPAIEAAIDNYRENYFWARNSWAHAVLMSKMHIVRLLQHMVFEVPDANKRLTKLENYQADIKKQKAEIIKKYKMSKWLKDFFGVMALLTLWRDDRKAEVQKMNHYFKLLGSEIARRSNMKWTDINICEPLSIKSIPVKKSLLKKYHDLLSKEYVVIWDGKKVVHCSPEKSKQLDKIFEDSLKTDSTELSGMVACQGKITAKVAVINMKSEFSKMTPGAILIANNTRPEYVPLMKQAGAIVTNEGGITSHAAIVSRELGVPCIIGTKVATEVFKDGDLVEVIASHQGIVRKIG